MVLGCVQEQGFLESESCLESAVPLVEDLKSYMLQEVADGMTPDYNIRCN